MSGESKMNEEISDKGGYGVRAKQFEKKAAEYRDMLNTNEMEYQVLYEDLKSKSELANNGLLNKLSNMIEFTIGDMIALAVWLIFFLLVRWLVQ